MWIFRCARTDLPAWSSRDPHDTRRCREDPDARFGRGKKSFLLGYLSLFLIDIEGFPLGHVEAPANENEKDLMEFLLDRVLGEGLEIEPLAADSQYSNGRMRGLVDEAVIPFMANQRPGEEVLRVDRKFRTHGRACKQ